MDVRDRRDEFSDDTSFRGMDRRAFLKGAACAAAWSAAGGLGFTGCDEADVENFFQAHFTELKGAELEEVLRRLRRQYKKKYRKDFTIGVEPPIEGTLFGYGLDLSRCVGCRRCVYACVMENNLSRDPQVHWIRVLELDKERGIDLEAADPYYDAPAEGGGVVLDASGEGGPPASASRNPADYALTDRQKAILRDPESQYPLYKKEPPREDEPPGRRVPREGHFYMPVACQQCRNPPCVRVCPVRATWQEPDGIVVVDYNWCIGCRYCMAACPYGARHFNWGEPSIPSGEVNTNTHYLGNRPRYRGNVEKCTFCIQRVRKGRYPACVEICPVGARKFGDLNDPKSEIRYLMRHKRVFVFKAELNTLPKFFYFYGF